MHRTSERWATSVAQETPELDAPWTNTTGAPSPASCTRSDTAVRGNESRRSAGDTLTDAHMAASAARNASTRTGLTRRGLGDATAAVKP